MTAAETRTDDATDREFEDEILTLVLSVVVMSGAVLAVLALFLWSAP